MESRQVKYVIALQLTKNLDRNNKSFNSEVFKEFDFKNFNKNGQFYEIFLI